MRTKTYDQLTIIFERFRLRKLSAYHPIMSDLVKYEDILDELSEMREDFKYTEDDDIEERTAIAEEISTIDKRRLRQWQHMMERFVVDTHYHDYIND